MKINLPNPHKTKLLTLGLLLVGLFALTNTAQAAELTLSPSSGTFSVGSTFDVSVFVDTDDEAVNALELDIKFPADKLQLVSPQTSLSIIEIWTSQPKFNNRTGNIKLQGGIPNGITTSRGLIATFTFRVRSVGSAVITFQDDTKVLLNDGLGTDALVDTKSAVYKLVLPPPQGPIVVSETHQEGVWSQQGDAIFSWPEAAGVEGYSYILDREPTTNPDNIVDSSDESVSYSGLGDGIHYFHIKALRNGVWGGVTHFALNVDATPPAEFTLEVLPSSRTSTRQPIVNFFSSDGLSGIDHYEVNTIPLSLKDKTPSDEIDQSFFVEAESPYVLSPLELGSYNLIVRAYDKAGNVREVTDRLIIVNKLFSFIANEGLVIKGLFTIPWWLLWLLLLILIGFLGWEVYHIHRWRSKKAEGQLPGHVKEQLEELKEYRRRYGKTVVMVLLLGGSLFGPGIASAQPKLQLPPPIVQTISDNVSNEEIFYIGGTVTIPESEIIVYTQNKETGSLQSSVAESDINGNWFYRHDDFLPTGQYIVWTQARIGEQLSPPGSQETVSVYRSAVQFGFSRISFELLYGGLVILLLIIATVLAFYILAFRRQAKRRRAAFLHEIREAEESVRRGFAVLRRDIESELNLVRSHVKKDTLLSFEAKEREEKLLRDLELVQKKIGREIWDIEEQLDKKHHNE